MRDAVGIISVQVPSPNRQELHVWDMKGFRKALERKWGSSRRTEGSLFGLPVLIDRGLGVNKVAIVSYGDNGEIASVRVFDLASPAKGGAQ